MTGGKRKKGSPGNRATRTCSRNSLRAYRELPFLLLVLFLFGCATDESAKTVSYWDLPTSHLTPANEKELHEECLRIRQEIARQQALPSLIKGSFFDPNVIRAIAAQNIARLENRAAEIGCPGAFSGGVIRHKSDLSFDECFKKCKELTGFTNEQCFEKCKE